MFSKKAAAFIITFSTVFGCIGACYAAEEYSAELSGAENSPVLYADSVTAPDYFEDELDNTSKMYDYTKNSWNAIALKQTADYNGNTGCFWLSGNLGPSDIIYKVDNGIRDFGIQMTETIDPRDENKQALFTFFVSNDGQEWTEIPPESTTVKELPPGVLEDKAYHWNYYEANDLPGGTRYLKFRFYRHPNALPTSDLWTPRITKVELNRTQPAENYIEASTPEIEGRKEDVTDNIQLTTKYFVQNIDRSQISIEPSAMVVNAYIDNTGKVRVQLASPLAEMTSYRLTLSDVRDVYGRTFTDSIEFTTGRGVVTTGAWLTKGNVKINSLEAGSVVPVFGIDNRKGTTGDIMLVALAFTNDSLSGISCKYVTDVRQGRSEITLDALNIDSTENTKVKMYALTNPNTMNPIPGITEITSEGTTEY